MTLSLNAKKKIAITGGIATGKSFVLKCFKRLGFPVFDSDEHIHQLMQPSGLAFAKLAQLFPEAVKKGHIDRTILGSIVLQDTNKLKILEDILHPLVREQQTLFADKIINEDGKSAVFEVPLLFEKNRQKHYDFIIVTTTSQDIQKARALARPNMSQEKLSSILDKQLHSEEKIKQAHLVIDTSDSQENIFNMIRNLIHD